MPTGRGLRAPRFRAVVKKLAFEETRGEVTNIGRAQDEDNMTDRKRISVRVRSCLARGYHPNANEHEAKTAIRMALRLMRQYNMGLAEVMKDVSGDDRTQFSGSSIVSIYSMYTDICLFEESWVTAMAQAMGLFFDCKVFSARMLTTIEWTFYGIAQNTVAAALAFEMVYNKVALWSWGYVGIAKRFSYCCGVGDGLIAMAKEERREEFQAAKDRERHGGHSNRTDPTSNDQMNDRGGADEDRPDFDVREDVEIQIHAELDAEIRRHMQQQAPAPAQPPAQSFWSSVKQLVSFRRTANEVADQWRRENNIKLCQGRKRTRVSDEEAYAQGERDSKRIDVRQRLLE